MVHGVLREARAAQRRLAERLGPAIAILAVFDPTRPVTSGTTRIKGAPAGLLERD